MRSNKKKRFCRTRASKIQEGSYTAMVIFSRFQLVKRPQVCPTMHHTVVSCSMGFMNGISRAQFRSSQLQMASRLPFIAGNWKMNTDLTSAIALANEVAEMTKDIDPNKLELGLVPPFPFIYEVFKTVQSTPQKLKIGAQSVYFEKKGAFTGAVSSTMLKSVGCSYVLVGHSERRKIFGEQDGEINNEMRSVLEAGLTPILCIGETKEEYVLGLNQQVCNLQLAKDLRGLTAEEISKLVIAYEPVWAIGTGLSATPEIAQTVHASIRNWLGKNYGQDIAQNLRILYGGSVTPETVDDLMKCPDIDGALVGGASLTAATFSRIAHYK
eukprot:gene5658-11415_t